MKQMRRHTKTIHKYSKTFFLSKSLKTPEERDKNWELRPKQNNNQSKVTEMVLFTTLGYCRV